MENTLENKAKFFALYWGQKVKRYNKSPFIELDFVDFIEIKECDFIELKPLSSISDEDAIEVAKIMKVDIENQLTNQIIEYIHGCITHFNCKGDMSFKISDYLRSRGYALPWMELSVEELVNRGWVKLKGETK
jgi:hypothetical protein